MPHQTVVKSSGATGADLTIAAGGLLWRKRNGQWEIAIVHRRRYGGDYTLPKGKVQRDETPLACALREVREETGWAAEPVDFAGQVTYPTNGTRKLVLFWTMRGDRELESGVDNDEVAEVLWLPAKKAIQQLSYPVERDLLARVTGTAIETTSSRVQRIISKLRVRRPAWLRSRRQARLEAAIRVSTRELRLRALQSNQRRAPWAVTARVLLQEARTFLQRGMILEGWHALQAARRLEISVMDDDERAALAAAMRAEADAKLSKWRRLAVAENLTAAVPSRTALRQAQYILDEHAQNDYRRLALTADHLSAMAVIIGILLVAVLYLASRVPVPVGTAQIEPFDLTVYVLMFGMLGGAVSAMLPRVREGGGVKRVPEQLIDTTFSKLRPVVGGASALVLYVLINSGLFFSGLEVTQGLVLVFAFAAGFSERVIMRAIIRVADPRNGEAAKD